MIASDIITAAFGLAGNASLDATAGLAKLNRILDKLYRHKFSWQRLTASVVFTAGAAYNTAQWDTRFLDFYEAEDGTVGRYTDPNGSGILSPTGLSYRQYINIRDRLTSIGQPRNVAADTVGGRWYVYPLGDITRTIDIDFYQLPAAIAASGTPLWSSHASDDILVDLLKTWAYEWQDDQRLDGAIMRAVGDLGAYRRKDQAKEGVTHQTALDERVFRRVASWDC